MYNYLNDTYWSSCYKNDKYGTYRQIEEAKKTSVYTDNLMFVEMTVELCVQDQVGWKVDIIIIRAIHWTITTYQAWTYLILTTLLNRYYYLHFIVKEAKVFINGVVWVQVTFKRRVKSQTQVYLAVKLRFKGSSLDCLLGGKGHVNKAEEWGRVA